MEKIPSFNELIQQSIIANWDMDALTDYKGQTLQYHDVARKIEKLHILFENAGVSAINMANKNSALVTVSSDTWTKLEKAGCVFLPRTNYREGTSVKTNTSIYWSSTAYSSYNAYYLGFFSNSVNPGTYNDSKYHGRMARCMVSGS